MKNVLVTPSYELDYVRCKSLVESVNRYVDHIDEHVLIVVRKDRDLLQSL